MNLSWLSLTMASGWTLALVGGVGLRVLDNFNGRRLEAYCRLNRNEKRFGEILDQHHDASIATQYLLLFGLVVGSLAAGAWFITHGDFELHDGKLSGTISNATLFRWIASWLLLLVLAGLWLPRIAVRYSSSIVLYHSWPLWKTLAFLTQPFSALGETFAWIGHRLSDEPETEDFDEEMLEDEIRTMVTAGQRDGVFAEGIPEMIQGVMNLDETDVEEIMTPRSLVDAVDVDMEWDEVVKQVADCGRTRIPVYRETLDNVLGILFVKDLLSAIADDKLTPGPETLESILRKPWFIPGIKSVDNLLKVFLHNRNHMAIVVDEYQQLIGVVTIEDALEEIVGEISDELDIDEGSEVTYDEATHQLQAEGKVPIEELEKLLGVNLPESDDYDTIGGLVIHRLSEIPTMGTTLDVDGVRITVLKSTKRLVQKVRLELIDSPVSGN